MIVHNAETAAEFIRDWGWARRTALRYRRTAAAQDRCASLSRSDDERDGHIAAARVLRDAADRIERGQPPDLD